MSSHSEAVRPSLNVTTQEEIKGDGLSHHGETEMDEARQDFEGRGSSSTDKRKADSKVDEQEGQWHETDNGKTKNTKKHKYQ